VKQTTWADARLRRLRRSHLVTPAGPSRAVEVVRDVCGLQAQLLSAAELALSARVRGVTRERVRDMLWTTRELVRAWTVRGTIHVIPSDDLPLWIAALGTHRYWESKEWLEREGLTAKEALAIFDTVVDTLSERPATRAQIAGAVVGRLGSRFRPKIASMWGDMFGPVTYMGNLCFGPSVGANVTFVRADRWIAKWPRIDPEHAWRELIRRFLRTYGPTPLEGVTRWFGIEPATALGVLRSLDDARAAKIEGRDAWMLANDATRARATGSVRLLAQYDSYVLGSHPGDTVIAPAARGQIRAYKRGKFEGAVGVPVLVVDGVVSGVWERVTRGGAIEITVHPAVTLTAAARRGIENEAGRVAAFFGLPATAAVV
jgi:hypothetical protein